MRHQAHTQARQGRSRGQADLVSRQRKLYLLCTIDLICLSALWLLRFRRLQCGSQHPLPGVGQHAYGRDARVALLTSPAFRAGSLTPHPQLGESVRGSCRRYYTRGLEQGQSASSPLGSIGAG